MIEQADRLTLIAHLEGILSRPDSPQEIIGLASEIGRVLGCGLGIVVVDAELVGQAQPGPIQPRVALECRSVTRDDEFGLFLHPGVDLGS